MLPTSKKILSVSKLTDLLSSQRRRSMTVVFTNGVFDILHPGHVQYLEHAARLGTHLVVALNSDASVRRLKGPTRPINNLKDRMRVIAGLESVAFVTSFGTDTPLGLIKKLNPDILCKGGDWEPSRIVGADWVLARGGKVLSLAFVNGRSTTRIIDKILTR